MCKIEMSDGLIPEILEACPSVLGFIRLRFSIDSVLKPGKLKLKLVGICNCPESLIRLAALISLCKYPSYSILYKTSSCTVFGNARKSFGKSEEHKL